MASVPESLPMGGGTAGAAYVASGRIPGERSMWFFVVGEMVIFGVYFVTYMAYRVHNEALFLASQRFMNQGVGIANTLVLLTSSLFVALGTETARSGRPKEAFRLISIAVGLGALFPLLKLLEWLPKLLAGHTPGENLFFTFYYMMTGLHLCHVLLGLIILSFVLRDLRQPSGPRIVFVETGATYWHMVDLLWLVLFALFYLMR